MSAPTSPTAETPISSSSEQTPIVTQKFTLDILNISQTSQIQNGLRQDDFTSYRKYCTRRLGRVRSSLKKQIGKKNYIAKLNDPKNITDARYLLIVLIKAERAWAYAMSLKQEFEQSDQSRLKFHMNNRFAKASLHAAQLERFCKEAADVYTQIESNAYAAWIRSSHLVAQQNWLEALESITTAKTVYSILATEGTASLRQLYQQRVDDAEPIERFCLYNMRSLDGSSSIIADTNKLLSKLVESTKKSTNQLLSTVNSSDKQQDQQQLPMSSINWRQRVVHTNEKVREKLAAYDVLQREHDTKKSQEEKFPYYEKMIKQLLDAEVNVRNEVINIVRHNTKNKTVKSEIEEQDLRALLAFISYNKYRQLFSRNDQLIQQFNNSTSATTTTTTAATAGSLKKKKLTTRDIIRIYTNQIKVFTQMIENRTETRPDSNLDAQLLLLKATRLYHIANGLADAKKWSETVATAERVSSMVATLKSKYKSVIASSESLKSRADVLEQHVNGIRSQIHANAFIEQMSNNEDLKKQMNELSIQPIQGQSGSKDLLTGLDNFDTSFLAEKRLVEFPPAPQPVPTKPLFFDLAFNQVQFPSLEARKKPSQTQKSGGLFGSFWGR